MPKEIKQRIVLEGEKEYNQALKEAQRNLKTLKSELKAETAELGKNATEQQKAEAKAKSLKAQIAEQEKIVKTLKAALAEVKDKYGDNAEEVARWEQRLNNARTTLANMKNDLEGVGEGLGTVQANAAEVTVATKSVADALGQISSVGSSVSDKIEGIFTGMLDRVTELMESLWDMIGETAAKANNWTDIAAYWGTDAQTIQGYARAVQATGNSFDDLQNAVTRMVLGGKGKKITELIGISDENYTNQWDYAMAVMNKLYDMRERGENMTPIWEEVFGAKKATGVMDLLNDWGTIRDLLPTFNGDESGYGMSTEELSVMDELWVKMNTIDEKWTAIKDNVAAGFGVVSLDLLVNVEGTLDGIADYLNATDDAGKQAALDKIRANVEEFFKKLGELIRDSIHIIKDVGLELKESDDPLTSAIGDILVKLSEGLQWMVDNADKVKAAFEIIFGIWLLAKLAAVAGQLSGILMQIEAIKAFRGVSVATTAAETAGASAGATWGSAFGSAVMKAVPWLAGILVFAENAITPQGNDDIWDENGDPTEMGRSLGITWTQEEDEKMAAENAGNAEQAAGRVSSAVGSSVINGQRRFLRNLERQQAAEAYWDELRDHNGAGVSWATETRLYDAYRVDNGKGEMVLDTEALESVLDRMYDLTDQDGWQKLENLPDTWDLDGRIIRAMEARPEITSPGGGNGGGGMPEEWQGLPGDMQTAAKAGVAAGIKGIRVTLDGRTVGRMVAPYVSEEIARDLEE